MYSVENSYYILPFQPQLPLPHPCSVIFYFVFWDDYSVSFCILLFINRRLFYFYLFILSQFGEVIYLSLLAFDAR